MLYLNDDYEGGSTQFCDINEWQSTEHSPRGKRQINPKTGKLLLFRQKDMKHCGSEILTGYKYIVQGMVMYTSSKQNKFGKGIARPPNPFLPATCDC